MSESTPALLASSNGRHDRPWQILRGSLASVSYASIPAFLVIALSVANVVAQPGFVAHSNWAPTLAVLCPFVLTSMAQALPVLSGGGGIDLSVGPLTGFITVFVGGVLVPHGLAATFVLIPIALAAGAAAGLANAILVAYVRLPPMVATLGTYLFLSGAATAILPSPGGSAPLWLVDLNGSLGGVPGVLLVFAVVAACWMGLLRTAFVHNLMAIGGDERAAYTAGIDVARVRLWAYVMAGVLSAAAGIMLSGLIQGGDATVGPSYTISSITAIALGGVILAGGKGGVLGAALGGVALFLVQNLLTLAGVSVFQLSVVNGVILVVALALSGVQEHFRGHFRTGLRTTSSTSDEDVLLTAAQ